MVVVVIALLRNPLTCIFDIHTWSWSDIVFTVFSVALGSSVNSCSAKCEPLEGRRCGTTCS